MSEVRDYDGITHKTKSKESYDQLTLTEQSCGGIRGRRTGVDEKCVECEVQSGASGVWKTKKKKKKGNPGGLGGKLKAHNLVIWLLFQQDPTVNSEKLNGHNTE